MQNINKIVTSRTFKWAMLVVAEIILLAITFVAGVKIGVHKARFSYAFGDNYERNFVGDPRRMMGQGFRGQRQDGMGFFRDEMRNAHGLSGTIVSISDNTIVVKDRNNNENTVSVSEKTLIKSQGGNLKISDLKTDDKIIVLGKPGDNGVINADLIRVFEDQQYNLNQKQ